MNVQYVSNAKVDPVAGFDESPCEADVWLVFLEHPARPAATRAAVDAVVQTACLRVSTGAVGSLKHVLVPEVLLPVSYTHLTLPTTERV